MLRELRIRNYAVIEDLALRLEPNLNVLTGETGAGKSIIVDALSLAVGERASSDVIRAGEARATIEAAFDVTDRRELIELCQERGIEIEEGWLVLKREVQAEGRNRAWINGTSATVSLLGELGSRLVDLHGQHEHQALLHAGPQREMLDAYAGAQELLTRLRHGWSELGDVRRRRAELEERRARIQERADLLRQQAAEIEAAEIQDPDEDQRLAEKERRLAHAEELLERVGHLYESLYGADDSLFDRLGSLRRELDGLARFDARTAEEYGGLYDSIYYTLQELGERLGGYRSEVDLDPARLERLRRRMDLLHRLKTRYGPTLADVAAAGKRARDDLDAVDLAGFELREMEEREAALARALDESAERLGKARRRAAGQLSDEVTGMLPELGMPDGRFEVALESRERIGPNGAEEIEFRVTVNRGFEPRPLSRVASGGELSRVMLALKTTLADLDRTPTLIFDEIDSGIGGIVGQKVAERLRAIARHHQVFVITHLPQIAAAADHHLLVTKSTRARKAAARIAELQGEDRVRDIARMLGGDPHREASLEHARAILGLQGQESGSTR